MDLSWTGLGCGRWRHGCGRHLLGSGDGGRGPSVGRAHRPARDLRLLPARPARQRHLRFTLGARQHVRLAPPRARLLQREPEEEESNLPPWDGEPTVATVPVDWRPWIWVEDIPGWNRLVEVEE